jgi:hypothetical protein
MINTINTKAEQLERGYFTTGSGNELIFFLGSCRSVPYLNYLDKWNNENGNRFIICFVDPFNFNYDLQDNRIDMEAKITSLETDETLLSMFGSCTIFVHEWYANYGMFNTNKDEPKNIYQFRMKPTIDICIPSWNDLFVLVGDIVSFDTRIRKMAVQDYNVIGKLSAETLKEIYEVRDNNLGKFYDICNKTSFPDFQVYFKASHKRERFFWNSNHVSNRFTLEIFLDITKKIGINYSNDFLISISDYDMYANNYTYITEYDEVNWHEAIKPLRELL